MVNSARRIVSSILVTFLEHWQGASHGGRAIRHRLGTCVLITVLSASAVVLTGCGGSSSSPEDRQTSNDESKGAISSRANRDNGSSGRSETQDEPIKTTSQFETQSTIRENAVENERTLGHLLETGNQEQSTLPPVDEDRIRAQGINHKTGKHIDLYTDIRDDSIEEFIEAFDQAVLQWAEYFGTDDSEIVGFRVRASYIQDKERFKSSGLLPAELPPFLHGYQSGRSIWVYVQPGPYFGRHLLLHEGTHAFMQTFLGGSGPPWYMEGMAELMATHRWEDGRVSLRETISDREDAPMWGRVKIIRDAVDDKKEKRLEEIFQYGWHAHLELEPYGWCWAACAFFDGHPSYQDRFRSMHQHAADRSLTFSQRFVDSLVDEWDQVNEQWQIFVTEMDYGYDVAHSAIKYQPVVDLPAAGDFFSVNGAGPWQSTGYRLQAGAKYQLTATGRYQVGEDTAPWMSEANGITLHYYRGLPLGRLIGAIRNESQRLSGWSPLVAPISIGSGGVIEPTESGTLFLRVNDSPARWHDNSGSLQVKIEPL